MSYVTEGMRRIVNIRAFGRCEYCLIHEQYAMKPHEVDHIYAEKHGGETAEFNLCLSCLDCNRYKGSDLCSLDSVTGQIIALFHPRKEQWSDHFQLNGAIIEPLTPTGRVTLRLLRSNDQERIAERETLIKMNRYPVSGS